MVQSPTPAVDIAGLPADCYLLDVREADEWEAGHAPEAVHVPLSELMNRAGEVPEDRDVYVVCKAGGRSQQAVQYLNQIGRTSVNVVGGMLAWHEAGRPMVSNGGEEPYVA
jgi:rhodanese-related sulfurtransferase